MSRHSVPTRLLALLLLLLAPLAAQDDEAPAPAPETIGKPAIDVRDLELKLAPYTLAELETEAKAWRDLVKAKAAEIAELTIEIRNLEEGAENKAQLTERLDALKAEETKRIERMNAVLDSWEAKGGDPAELRAYATALRGVDLDAEDPASVAAAFRRWVESEDGLMKWLIKLGIFVLIVIVAMVIAGIVGKIVDRALGRHKGTSALLDRFIHKIVVRGIVLVGVIIGLSTLGVNVGALLALIGGGAFILGFALQDTLANFANGIMLMIYQPFDVGDAVDVAGVSGSVDSVSLVNTTIRSWDNQVILVPNKLVWGQVITNITGSDKRRVDMTFGISYDDDVDKAQEILEKIVRDHELVLDDPEPVIRMHELADSSVNFVVRPWAKTSDYWSLYWDVTKQVKKEFDAAGISIPYPQQDVYMHQVEAKAG